MYVLVFDLKTYTRIGTFYIAIHEQYIMVHKKVKKSVFKSDTLHWIETYLFYQFGSVSDENF